MAPKKKKKRKPRKAKSKTNQGRKPRFPIINDFMMGRPVTRKIMIRLRRFR